MRTICAFLFVVFSQSSFAGKLPSYDDVLGEVDLLEKDKVFKPGALYSAANHFRVVYELYKAGKAVDNIENVMGYYEFRGYVAAYIDSSKKDKQGQYITACADKLEKTELTYQIASSMPVMKENFHINVGAPITDRGLFKATALTVCKIILE